MSSNGQAQVQENIDQMTANFWSGMSNQSFAFGQNVMMFATGPFQIMNALTGVGGDWIMHSSDAEAVIGPTLGYTFLGLGLIFLVILAYIGLRGGFYLGGLIP